MKLRESRDEYHCNNLTIKFLVVRCRFFSGRVWPWRRFLRLCCVSMSYIVCCLMHTWTVMNGWWRLIC